MLIKSNIYPEELPAEEDVKKLERRIKNQDEEILLESEELAQKDLLPLS